MNRVWTEEEKRQIEALLKAGHNGKEIAARMKLSYGTVCGLIWRVPYLRAAQKERVAAMEYRDRKKAWDQRGRKTIMVDIEPPLPNLKPTAYDAKAVLVPLMDLKPNQCRYPVAHDREHLFCGHARWNDTTMYCEHHQRRCMAQPHIKPVKQRPIGFGE